MKEKDRGMGKEERVPAVPAVFATPPTVSPVVFVTPPSNPLSVSRQPVDLSRYMERMWARGGRTGGDKASGDDAFSERGREG